MNAHASVIHTPHAVPSEREGPSTYIVMLCPGRLASATSRICSPEASLIAVVVPDQDDIALSISRLIALILALADVYLSFLEGVMPKPLVECLARNRSEGRDTRGMPRHRSSQTAGAGAWMDCRAEMQTLTARLHRST